MNVTKGCTNTATRFERYTHAEGPPIGRDKFWSMEIIAPPAVPPIEDPSMSFQM